MKYKKKKKTYFLKKNKNYKSATAVVKKLVKNLILSYLQ
jgi:hypothetical protein